MHRNPAPLVTPALTQFVRDLASSVLTKRALFQRLTDTACELLPADASVVLERDGDGFRVVSPSGLAAQYDGVHVPIKQGPSLFREVLTARHAAAVNDTATDPRVDLSLVTAMQVRHIAVAPIVLDDQVDGLLVAVNTVGDGFDDTQLAVLEHLAAHGAIVMHSQTLVERAEEAVQQARARAEDAAHSALANAILARTARAFANATSRDALYQALGEVLTFELHAVGFTIYEANPQQRTSRVAHEWGIAGTWQLLISTVFWNTAHGRAVLSGEALFIDDLASVILPGAQEQVTSLVEQGIGSVALLPLMIEERPYGLLSIRWLGRREFPEHDQHLLRDFATQVALAVRNTVHMHELERRARRLAMLARAQQQLTQLASEDSLPLGIAEAVHLVMPAAICEVLAFANGELRRVVRLEQGSPVSPDREPLADLTCARLTAESGITRACSHLAPGADVARGSTELCAAVRFGQRSAGVIRLIAIPDEPFDAQDLDLLTIIARHAGTAVESSRLFALQDLQRQRAEGAAELARTTLQAGNVTEGATELLHVLDRFVPSIGKAIGAARGRDGMIEYVATSGTLDVLQGHRPGGLRGVSDLSPDGRGVEFTSLRDAAPDRLPDGLRGAVPDEWAFMVPLVARDRTIGVLLVTAPRQAPLLRRDRVTLERLSASLALALDALLLDEEERLAREREHLLATALTTINHPIFILDRVGIRYANPAAAAEYGWTQAELMEMQFEQLVVGVESREARDDSAGVIEHGVRLSHDVHRRRDDSEFPAAVSVSPLVAHDGDLLGQVVSVRNVSNDRRFEEQLRHTEKMVALGELVAGVAHEINNPLTGISAFAQILLEETLGDEQRESVQLIKQESDRAKAVIQDLLLFARKTERGTGPVDVNEMLAQSLRLRAYPLRVAGVQVHLELDPGMPKVHGDVQKLQQVLLNVIGNAEHAMQDCAERTLTMRTARDGDNVVISARDTGRGMTPDVQRRIFEPFFSTKAAGTGLGLSVSYGIIHAYGGTIAVDSEPDVGTTVTIVLPAIPA
jgi:PAS domain S-box-containing protein